MGDGLEFTGPMDSDVGEKGPAKQVAPRASFISRAFVRHPCKILWLTNLLLVACSTLGALLAEAPDFAQANKGFEPRGTELADRYNAIRQVVAYPRHRYCGYLCPRDEGFVRMLSDGKAEALRRGDAEPLAPAPARRLQGGDERGLLGNLVVSCYAQLAIVKPAAFLVLQSSEEADLLSPELLRDLCEAGAVVEESAAYTDRCQTFQGACCPLLTLPRALAFLQLALQQQASGSQASPAAGRVLAEPRLGCGELGDVALALQRYAQCSEALLSGACDRGSFMCAEASLAASCEAINPMVNLLMMYMATRGWQPPSALTTTGLVLPVEDEGHYEVYYDLQNELPQYFSGETSLQIVAMQLREKFPLFQRRLFLDSAWAVLAAVVGMTCMILHTRSVFISLMTSLQVTLGMTFSYFLFRIVFQAPFFTFLNMNMLFCAVAIGIDDVFVFMDAYRQSYYFLAPETDVEGRMEWTFRRAFGAMLVTTLTTSVAFSANIMSPITVVKNFGAFAAIVIITDFVCMMLVLPSALIISEFGILKDFCRCCGSWNRPMPEVWAQKSQRHIVERFFEEKVARVIVLGRWFFVFVLTILGVVAITQTLGLKSSNAEALQLFVDSHLVERFDQYWSAEFQWFADFRSGMGLPVNIVAGVLPADAGDYQDPDNFGPMERAPEDLTSAASQLWYAELCTRLPSAPFFRRLYRGGCLFDGVRRYAGGGCDNLDTPCCPQAQPQSWPLASERLSQCALEFAAFGELYGHAGRQLSDSAAARRELAASVLAEAENLKGRYNWGQGVAFDEEGRLIAMVFGYDSSEAYTANVELLGAFYDTVESWATGALDAPSGVPRPFWWTGQLGWYALMKGLQDGAYSAAGAALGFCLAVLLLVVGNVVMAFYALVTILFVLSLVIWCLIGCGWVLDLNTAVVLAICVGMCVDFVCHMSHAYVEAPTGEGGESWPAERFRRTTHALGTMGISVTFGAGSTLLGGSAMFPAQVKFFFQFGTFLVFTMFWSLLYAVFYFPALSAVAGVAGHFGDLRTIVVGLRALCGCGPKVAVSPEGEASATSGKMKISRVTPTEE